MPLLPLQTPKLEMPSDYDNGCIPNNQDLQKDELDIFYRSIEAFIPEGKTWNDLTPEEQKTIQAKYRFDPFRPGMYQAITGLGKMVN